MLVKYGKTEVLFPLSKLLGNESIIPLMFTSKFKQLH